MSQTLAYFTLLVRDYDEAIDFYVRKLGFVLLEDTPRSDTKRWVRVAPNAHSGSAILLAKANTEAQVKMVGNQAAGRVWLFLHTDNFDAFEQNLQQHQIEIVRPPSVEEFGKVLVFADLYGNKWDLIEPAN